MSWAEIKKVINSDLNKPLNEGGVKIVKSVQRGKVNHCTTSSIDTDFKVDPTDYGIYMDITINSVNTSKSIVNISPCISNGHTYDYAPILLNSTTIRVYVTSSGHATKSDVYGFTWQVIEFY